MNSLNDLLSDTLQVKQLLKEGETIQFELLNRHKKEPGRDEPSCPEYVALSEKEMIYDVGANEGQGGPVVIMNIESFEPITTPDGKLYNKPILKKMEFKKGLCTLTHEQNNQVIFALRSKKLIDNPFRGRGAKAMYRLINSKKEEYDRLQDMDLQWRAEKLIREGDDWNKVRAIQLKLNKSLDARLHTHTAIDDLQGLKLVMIQLAKRFPKQVIGASDDAEAKNRVYIADAITFNILLWTQENSTWTLLNPSAAQKDQKIVTLTTVSPDEDKVEALLKYFMTEEGRKSYALFVNALNKILKSVRGTA